VIRIRMLLTCFAREDANAMQQRYLLLLLFILWILIFANKLID